MNERESDPTGAFRGGSAGLEGDGGDEEQNTGSEVGGTNNSQTPGVDVGERQAITSGVAATSEVADPEAQRDAEAQGDGTPLPS